MIKWAIAGIVYVGLVIGGYTAYTKWFVDEKEIAAVGEHGEEESHTGGQQDGHSEENQNESHNDQDSHGESDGHGEETGGHGGHGKDSADSESSQVNVFLKAEKDEMNIFINDLKGNPVEQLEIEHEKILHLIVVDERMGKFYHLHPKQVGKGEFTVAHDFPDGSYKAFVDIKPKDLAYSVTPIPFIVNQPSHQTEHSHGLEPDKALTQEVEGEKVTLKMSSNKANEPVKLTFEMDKTNLTPYLGAMGHVVILDQGAQNYLHVHPANDEEPVFETEFKKPGVYKIWGQFKQGGKVRTFPFVVEIE